MAMTKNSPTANTKKTGKAVKGQNFRPAAAAKAGALSTGPMTKTKNVTGNLQATSKTLKGC